MKRKRKTKKGQFFRPTSAKPVSTRVRKYIRLVDSTSGLIFFYKVWNGSCYPAIETRYLHRWKIKSVLRRAGVRA